jgi:hypothetical protein
MLQQFPRSCVSHTFTADSLPALTGADLGNRAKSRGTSPELGAHGCARRYQPFRSTDTGGHKLHTEKLPLPGGRLGGPLRWRGNFVATGPAVTRVREPVEPLAVACAAAPESLTKPARRGRCYGMAVSARTSRSTTARPVTAREGRCLRDVALRMSCDHCMASQGRAARLVWPYPIGASPPRLAGSRSVLDTAGPAGCVTPKPAGSGEQAWITPGG